jgi:hypothetical protein
MYKTPGPGINSNTSAAATNPHNEALLGTLPPEIYGRPSSAANPIGFNETA